MCIRRRSKDKATEEQHNRSIAHLVSPRSLSLFPVRSLCPLPSQPHSFARDFNRRTYNMAPLTRWLIIRPIANIVLWTHVQRLAFSGEHTATQLCMAFFTSFLNRRRPDRRETRLFHICWNTTRAFLHGSPLNTKMNGEQTTHTQTSTSTRFILKDLNDKHPPYPVRIRLKPISAYFKFK